jgi:hypothetical protein
MAGRDTEADGWYTSSLSGGTGCVEVCVAAERVQVRDTKDRQGAFLTFTHAEWQAFLAGVRLGEFDLENADRRS